MNLQTNLAIAIATAALMACGGGTSDAPITAFPMLSGYQALVTNGFSKKFTVSGQCTGTGELTVTAAVAANFEGVAGLSNMTTTQTNALKCTDTSTETSPGSKSFNSYFDKNDIPRGHDLNGTEYGVYLTVPSFPAMVSIADKGTIGTETLYSNTAKAAKTGSIESSYAVEYESATTAIITLTAKYYNASGTLHDTEQYKYRLSSTGAWVPVSIDLQAASSPTTHLLLTYN